MRPTKSKLPDSKSESNSIRLSITGYSASFFYSNCRSMVLLLRKSRSAFIIFSERGFYVSSYLLSMKMLSLINYFIQ